MDKYSLLSQIKTTLEGLLNQTQKLENEEHSLYQIDKDLLLEKTRALYEKMMALENISHEEKVPADVPTQDTTIPAVEEIPEQIVKTEEEVMVEVPETESQDASEPEPEIADNQESEEEYQPEEITAIEENTAEPEPVVEKSEQAEKPADLPKTTLDLFSEAPSETLGDALSHTEKPAVADSLQKNGINDLREAIGINDKFLFINELFNGDLERYNKVIDELNSFSGFLGAQTYLTELQVQYQWDENATAYQKLSNLLERKFA